MFNIWCQTSMVMLYWSCPADTFLSCFEEVSTGKIHPQLKLTYLVIEEHLIVCVFCRIIFLVHCLKNGTLCMQRAILFTYGWTPIKVISFYLHRHLISYEMWWRGNKTMKKCALLIFSDCTICTICLSVCACFP